MDAESIPFCLRSVKFRGRGRCRRSREFEHSGAQTQAFPAGAECLDLEFDRLVALKQVLGKHPGECRVALHLIIPDETETVIALPRSGVRPGKALQRDLSDLFGRDIGELAF